MDPVHVGFGGIVAANRILAILDPNSQPVRRMVHRAKKEAMAIDMTYGRKTRTVIILDTGHVITAAVQPETIVGRLRQPFKGALTETE
ncbi:MAG: extracellular matrix/biofilm biosynthesis regulator RemA family protein [Anaerolineae bacterium]